MSLSVIIPTRNRVSLLSAALQSICAQTLPRSGFEVIVVDNGSTDNTRSEVEKWQASDLNLRYEYELEPGLHVGRHAGACAAKGEILIFADDDIEAYPTWLETYAEIFEDQQVAMAGGNNIPMFLATPPNWLSELWRFTESDVNQMLPALSLLKRKGGRAEFSPHLVWGCNFAIRKEILFEAGGFNPDGVPADRIQFRGDGETAVSDFVASSPFKCIFDPHASVYHKVTESRMTHKYFYDRGYAQGISDSFTQLRGRKPAAATPFLWLRIARKIRRLLRERILLSAESRRALTETSRGYRAGFRFHQARYIEDPELKIWVHKHSYW